VPDKVMVLEEASKVLVPEEETIVRTLETVRLPPAVVVWVVAAPPMLRLPKVVDPAPPMEPVVVTIVVLLELWVKVPTTEMSPPFTVRSFAPMARVPALTVTSPLVMMAPAAV